MRAALPPFRECRVLLCNDDGYDRPGLAILRQAAEELCDDVWWVAPRSNQTARGRSYSIAREVEGEQVEGRGFVVEGTPVDCVILGLNGLIAGRRPDLVLSGVNEGTNLAEDIPASGTVGACLEAADQGVPAIAFSQVGTYGTSGQGAWTASESLLSGLLPDLVEALDQDLPVLNVNFPQLASPQDCLGRAVTAAGRRPGPLRVERRGPGGSRRFAFFYDLLRDERPAYPGCDIDLALKGYVTITPLTRDPTHHAGLAGLRSRLGADAPSG